jgi:hypothetical protein
MLCYSASMCRGYLHAKSLGEGGEFLSYVWLLISLIGGRTLADKLQMPDDDPEPEGKVVEGPAKDKGEQKPKPEAAGSSGPTLISDIGIGHLKLVSSSRSRGPRPWQTSFRCQTKKKETTTTN